MAEFWGFYFLNFGISVSRLMLGMGFNGCLGASTTGESFGDE